MQENITILSVYLAGFKVELGNSCCHYLGMSWEQGRRILLQTHIGFGQPDPDRGSSPSKPALPFDPAGTRCHRLCLTGPVRGLQGQLWSLAGRARGRVSDPAATKVFLSEDGRLAKHAGCNSPRPTRHL